MISETSPLSATAVWLSPQPHQPAIATDTDQEIDQLAEALSRKFEELTLIHQLSERLTLNEESEHICHGLLTELAPCIGAETLAIDLPEADESGTSPQLFQTGRFRSEGWLRDAARRANLCAPANSDSTGCRRVAIVNHPAPDDTEARVVVVPIQPRGMWLGQMIAVRSLDAEEFGTIEADMMKSTSMMLGVHLINQRQYLELQEMFEGTVHSLVSALDAKDAYTCGHSSRVAELAVELGRRLGFHDDRLATIRMAGILHDIGKIGVEDSVLRKTGRLTDEEFEQIKQHPVLGFEILRGIRPLRRILPAVRHHHECWDGSGYPDGLAAESIPRDAQVLAVADAFDAMTSDRPYRSGMPLEKVIAIFREGRGCQWAADVVDVLLDSPQLMESFVNRGSKLAVSASEIG